MSERANRHICPACGEPTDRPYLACSRCSDQRRAEARAAKNALPANLSRIEEHRERARQRAAASREQLQSWSPRFVADDDEPPTPFASHPWTTDDDDVLRANAALSAGELSDRLGRSVTAIDKRRHRLRQRS